MACIPLHSACRYHLHLPVGLSTASTLSSVMLEPSRCLHLVGDVTAAPPAQSRSQACSEVRCLRATMTICTYVCTYVRTSCMLASSFTKLHTSVLSLQLGHKRTLEQVMYQHGKCLLLKPLGSPFIKYCVWSTQCLRTVHTVRTECMGRNMVVLCFFQKQEFYHFVHLCCLIRVLIQ